MALPSTSSSNAMGSARLPVQVWQRCYRPEKVFKKVEGKSTSPISRTIAKALELTKLNALLAIYPTTEELLAKIQ